MRLSAPVRGLTFDGDRVSGVAMAEGETRLEAGESVILATPPWISQTLVPGLDAPDEFNAIVNGHFRFVPPPGLAPIVGVIGGAAQWIFAFDDRLSVTVSAAGDMADQDREELAHLFWRDIAAVHGLPAEPSALAHRQGAPRHLRRHPGPERQTPPGRHRLA